MEITNQLMVNKELSKSGFYNCIFLLSHHYFVLIIYE